MIRYLFLFPCVLGLLAMGCAEGPVKPDPAVVQSLRDQLLLEVDPESAEPGSAVTPLGWRETPVEGSVVLVGRVGGMPNPWPKLHAEFPWVGGEATFFLVDIATADEFLEHTGAGGVEEAEAHAADCPFCAREAANKTTSIAAVSFMDPGGKPIEIDARELFGLAAGETVVVRGKASLLGEDLLVVEADGLFRRE